MVNFEPNPYFFKRLRALVPQGVRLILTEQQYEYLVPLLTGYEQPFKVVLQDLNGAFHLEPGDWPLVIKPTKSHLSDLVVRCRRLGTPVVYIDTSTRFKIILSAKGFRKDSTNVGAEKENIYHIDRTSGFFNFVGGRKS